LKRKIDGNQSLKLSKNIKIVDYGFGNLASVKNAINFSGFEASLVNNPNDLKKTSHLILPGVGSFEAGVEKLKKDGWIKKIHEFVNKGGYLLGICLGMQLLFKKGTNERSGFNVEGIGLLEGICEKFTDTNTHNLPLPHIGFNKVTYKNSNIWKGIPQNSFFYFVHSYRVINTKTNDYKISMTNYGDDFVSFIEHNKIYGAQFHPEKSHTCGLKLLKNFCNLK
jgi:imidazole glycerol-phosphate synthase subunit HisH